jgi:hypothetical protein
LFTWTGNPVDQPLQRDADLTGLNPEGIVEIPAGSWSPATLFQLVSDNGTNRYYGDDIEAKHLEVQEFKKFRVDRVALGNVVAPAPLIRAVTAADGQITVNWLATPNTRYRVQMSTQLNGAWSDVPGDVSATDAIASKSLSAGPHAQCFFRIISTGPAADPRPSTPPP